MDRDFSRLRRIIFNPNIIVREDEPQQEKEMLCRAIFLSNKRDHLNSVSENAASKQMREHTGDSRGEKNGPTLEKRLRSDGGTWRFQLSEAGQAVQYEMTFTGMIILQLQLLP